MFHVDAILPGWTADCHLKLMICNMYEHSRPEILPILRFNYKIDNCSDIRLEFKKKLNILKINLSKVVTLIP